MADITGTIFPRSTPPAPPVEFDLGQDVLFLQIHDGSARLLDLDGDFYAIPAVGAAMLRETLTGGVEAAVARLSSDFAAPAEQIRTDLHEFLNDLVNKGLVERGTRAAPRAATSWQWASVVNQPLLRVVDGSLRSLTWRVWFLLLVARFSLALFGWARTVAVWQRYCHATLPRSLPKEQPQVIVARIDAIVRAVSSGHIVAMDCKERSICSWFVLRRCGVPASLTIGIELYPFRGHCWCESEGYTVGDDPTQCRHFTAVAHYD